jgi:hypothetical protein
VTGESGDEIPSPHRQCLVWAGSPKGHWQAYDEAWREIAGNFGDDPGDIELARTKLASALLSVACEESRDVEVLKNGALQAMAFGYREREGIPLRSVGAG